MAAAIGLDETAREEVAIAASELAANLVKHAGGGSLTLMPLVQRGRAGIQIESVDSGGGIADVSQAMVDGFSTAGSLGYGLGTVNRLMDELEVTSHQGSAGGTRIVCRRWFREHALSARPCPLSFGAATRPRPHMTENGDAFVLKRWGESGLVAVIDGLGHGQFARRAAQVARQYVEAHYDQPLEAIFRGVERACRATRGVVMALARFDWGRPLLTFASLGNVEVRVFDNSNPMNFILRRGIIGANAPLPVVTEHPWDPRSVLVLHSDGVRAHWRWEDFPDLAAASATVAALHLLRALAKDDDDATVVVVKGQDDSP
jgi:anti-sigma regulatory factor (Ser/Thr protein kinase)/serine/threonine protein phosphatase PrpC